MRFKGNSFCPKMAKLDFFTMKLDFSPRKLEFPAILSKFYITKYNLTQKFAWGDPFYCIFIIKIHGKRGKFTSFSTNLQDTYKKLRNYFSERVKLVFKMPKPRFQNAKTA